MARRQSNNQWSGGTAGHPALKNSECKNPLEISRLDFLGSRRHPPHWLCSKRPNYQREVLLIPAGAIEGHFEGKTLRKIRQGGFVLARQCPGAPNTCNPVETGVPGLRMPRSPALFSGPGPVALPPVPWTEKTIGSSPFFARRGSHWCLGDRLDGQTSNFFFEWLAKVGATG